MSTITIRPAVDAADLSTVDSIVETKSDVMVAGITDVFPQSIASGGPTSTGIILWTRIAPEHYNPSESLRLEVASDESFTDILVRRELQRPSIKATDNYTVRVDLQGFLKPDSVYYYRFGYRGVRSRIGRCRTLPSDDAPPESIRFGVLNCQNYQNGYFGAMAHLADAEVDFVLHLGDYIYEDVITGYPKGKDGPYKDRRIDLPDGETLPMSLNDFRCIYEVYKADPHLRRLHERHTVIQTWDDHSIADDRYWDYETDAPVFPKHPCGDVSEFTRYLTRAGIQAWWEFVPARITHDPDATHIHDSFGLYRSIRFGNLVTLLLTDERLFRSEPLSFAEKLSRRKRTDPSRTMLGTTQREWLSTELQENETPWTVWANSVLFKPLTVGLRFLTPGKDSWDGFEAERANIMEKLNDVRRECETTVVTLTGDMHTTLATHLRNEGTDTARVGVEFMTPAVTAVNLHEKIQEFVGSGLPGRLVSRVGVELVQTLLKAFNQDYELIDSVHWGYSVIEFSQDACTWTIYWVDKTVNSEEAKCEPAYQICVPAGEYVIEDQSSEIEGTT